MNLRRIGLATLVVALVAAGIVVTRIVTQSDQEDIYLEAAASTGPDPFTTTAITPTSTTALGVTTTALFGGTGSQQKCDPEALIAFLMSNPDKAAAWVAALNSDPTLRWSGGTQLQVSDIPTYVRTELAESVLKFDTRVTNHGFKNGKETPRQSLLQAGTHVLIDKEGIARVRCACGNPLIPPHKVDNPNYVGECWPGCHDRPPCSGPGCAETTTTQPPTTTTVPATTTTCIDTPGTAGCDPPPRTTTTQRPPPRTTTTPRPTITTLPPTVTTVRPTTVPTSTSTTCSPNDPQC